jgi:iron complex outermembrane receptor protein
MKFGTHKLSLLIGGSMLAMFVPTVASAADQAPAAEAAVGNDIVVTATRQQLRLQDVPMSVNVATGEELQKFKIFDVKDISQLAPGLELTNTTGRNNTTTLRGVTFDPDQGTGPAVRVYLDETPVDAQTAYTAIYDIQQIEVLRGPQGLLRGLSSPAGSITIATRKPGFDRVEGDIQATGTDRGGYNVQGGVTLPFSDQLSIRVAGLVDGNRLNNVRDFNRNGQRSQSRTESARVTIGWRPTDSFKAYLTYQYLTADNRQFQQVIGNGGNPLGVYGTLFGFPSAYILGSFPTDTTVRSGPALTVQDRGAVQEGVFRNQNNTHFINLQADYDLGPATLSFVGAHQFTKLTIDRDLDAANAIPGYVQNSTVVTPYKVDTAELRLTSNNAEGLGWGVGAFYTKQSGITLVNQDNSLFQYNVAGNALVNPSCDLIGTSSFCPTGTFAPFTIPNALPLSVFVRVPVNSTTYSFNANLSYRAGPLKIEAGVRYSILKGVQTTQQQLSGAFNTPLLEIIPANLQRSDNRPVTGGATISYEVTPNLNVYGSYGHSFRSGSTKVAGPGGVSADLIRTNPEKTDSYEIGFKGSAFDRRVNFSVAAFYQKLDGFLSRFTSIYYFSQTDQPQTGGFDFNYNGNAKIKGIEGSLDLRPTPNWDLGVSAAYTHARWDNARLPCNDYAGTGIPNTTGGVPKVTGTGNVSYCVINDRLANTPDFSLNANTEIRFPMATVTPFVRALMTYTPSYNWWQSQYRFQDRELINLYVGARSNDGKWELDLFAKNLLNQQRITNISLGQVQTNAAVKGTFSPGYSPVNVMNPREFGATLSFHW